MSDDRSRNSSLRRNIDVLRDRRRADEENAALVEHAGEPLLHDGMLSNAFLADAHAVLENAVRER